MMEILVCFDHLFLTPCGVMLKSLVENNKEESIHIHAIINKDVTLADKDSLRNEIERNNIKIDFYEFNAAVLEDFPGLKGTHYAESNYYRLFCSSILPDNISKVLYLDCDLIINDNLIDLWNTEVTGKAIAAVINPLVKRIEIQDIIDGKYFNSGVMLINVDYWRQNDMELKFVDCIEKCREYIIAVDQDVINIVLQSSIIELPLRYNVQHPLLYQKRFLKNTLDNQYSELDSSLSTPAIVHFTGSKKPWNGACKNPFRPLYYLYLKKTKWMDFTVEEGHKDNGAMIVRRFFAYLLHLIGLRRSVQFCYDRKMCDHIYKSCLMRYENSDIG